MPALYNLSRDGLLDEGLRIVGVDHNAITGEELRKRHAVHFQKMDEHIRELNKKFGKTVLYVAPASN